MEGVAKRKQYTSEKIAELVALLHSSKEIVDGRACVYATGSFGRGEAGTHSDLDLCIVLIAGSQDRSLLSRLDEICLKADLISVVRKSGLPEIDGDGRYLGQFEVNRLIGSIGSPEDDVTNTFTSRMLLLLESYPLLGPDIRKSAIDDIISAYWMDYSDHKENFIPAYLANDIMRLWRTFCVNYEARTRDLPDDRRPWRRTKNYKLKHSRIMTFYSSLLLLLARYGEKGTVDPQDAIEMSSMTPIERIQSLREDRQHAYAHQSLSKLIEHYDRFLDMTNVSEKELAEKMAEKSKSDGFSKEASAFGRAMFDSINMLGKGNEFHRLLMV